jgi:hypothetical protein
MIKLIITIAALIMSFFASAQTQGKTAQANFKGKLCDIGRGLCTIDSLSPSNKSTTMKAIKTYKKSENTMVIEMDVMNLSKEEQNKFFGKEYARITPNEKLYFIQDEDYVFDLDTLLYLDFDYHYKYLKKGNYPLEIKDDKIYVTLTLTKQ